MRHISVCWDHLIKYWLLHKEYIYAWAAPPHRAQPQYLYQVRSDPAGSWSDQIVPRRVCLLVAQYIGWEFPQRNGPWRQHWTEAFCYGDKKYIMGGWKSLVVRDFRDLGQICSGGAEIPFSVCVNLAKLWCSEGCGYYLAYGRLWIWFFAILECVIIHLIISIWTRSRAERDLVQ